jgi:hypothetical protein
MVIAWYVAGEVQVTRELPLSLLGGVLLLLGVLAVAAVVIIYMGRWVKRTKNQTSDDLAYYRLLYEQGEFSREEYEQIRAKLGVRLRQELDLPPAPDGGKAAAAPDPDTQDTNIRAGTPVAPPPPPSEPPSA